MSVLAYYFGWYTGAVWSNLIASVICVGVAWWRLRARMIAHHLEQLAQKDRHHAEHMDALSLETPGGLAVVMAEVKDARMAAESAYGAVQGLTLMAGGTAKPAAGATRIRKTASDKDTEAARKTPAAPAGMGSRITSETPRSKA